MSARLANPFQFLDVDRKDPGKKNMETRTEAFVEIYDPFTDDQISIKIAQLLKNNNIKAEVNVIFQKLSGLHKACPKNLGDWYFSGNYPTPGGCRVVNQAFINFIEKSNKRAY